jgi:uncharacterized membrane protein SpoIIM required for sporulation
MTPAHFEKHVTPRRERLEHLLNAAEKGSHGEQLAELPTAFREVCHDLSVAQHRMLPPRLTEQLNALVIRGFRQLERRTATGLEGFLRMMLVEFPQQVRAEWRLVALCSLVTWVPMLAFILLTPAYPEWAMSLLGPDGMASAEQMYGKGANLVEELRGKFGSDFAMFGFYIWNNVSIDFRTYVGGLAGGVGALTVLLFNGMYLGAFAGYVRYAADPQSFFLWVSGHSALEITGMILSGVAGCRLGFSALMPGRLRRRDALVMAGRKTLPIMLGAALMTAMAAVIEGFWSPQPFPPLVKYSFGALQWLMVISFLAFAGRGRAHEA